METLFFWVENIVQSHTKSVLSAALNDVSGRPELLDKNPNVFCSRLDYKLLLFQLHICWRDAANKIVGLVL